ncbi:MAG TPA: molybdopterin-guanine dinucleotide biosynthesis protein MobB [Bacillota bacterium]|jgi:molybdopterin-guanine dinucleotide biosynthesis protein B|nr:molybdopterin-guanine dinucleotide biosynthesis protein MobB [Bacillota bacterium]HOP69342.1 molybdopterin-guanine dinucleotide biosynthesis protein MobB [Bacillota bacterium]HPT34638.1 molybdopterin-guanine dinucleotide biosynthesis protein MobB [Bacillota bacterium]HPZ65754.1 molybdopterin-guanine dinucleotide biosynthesis protein MobB [Bacillota bacterium]HQD06203.1 molybdopterin-guanine dinucleotide biosynthesis protein MobB [Bacillota bacterium]
MKVFSVIGITKSGKTTVVEKLIGELRRRRYTVGSVKDIHFEKFAIDTEGTNTYRHKMAGSQLVTARGLQETDVLFPRRLSVGEILAFYQHDFVALEGVDDYNVPKIVAAHHTGEVDERLDDSVFAISGVLANEGIKEYRGLPVFNVLTDAEALVDLIEEKVPRLLPDFPPECCSGCGMSCREFLAALLRGERRRSDCLLESASVRLKIGGREIAMVPFVQEVLRKTVVGLVSTLEGYRDYAAIEISIEGSKGHDQGER